MSGTESGATITVVHRPGHGVSVARWFAANDPVDARVLLTAETTGTVTFAEYLRPYLLRAAGREAGAAPRGTNPGAA